MNNEATKRGESWNVQEGKTFDLGDGSFGDSVQQMDFATEWASNATRNDLEVLATFPVNSEDTSWEAAQTKAARRLFA